MAVPPPAAEEAGPVVTTGVHTDGHSVLSHDLSCLSGSHGSSSLPLCLPGFCEGPRLPPESQSPGLLWATRSPHGHRRGGRDIDREGGKKEYDASRPLCGIWGNLRLCPAHPPEA